MPLRSERQFNTVVYENEDIYRGNERRDVVMMNEADQNITREPVAGQCASPAIGSGDAHAPDVTVDHETLTRIATMATTSEPTSTTTATSSTGITTIVPTISGTRPRRAAICGRAW
jgi:hypothetical protein